MQQLNAPFTRNVLPKSIGIEFSAPSLTMINFRLENHFNE
jgi:hypothetical protein